ncbi:PIG-L family deacetylase [Micromonospora sp. M12]
MRRAELDASCAVLKVSHLETLGYADSGMMGWATNDQPGAFWTTPVAEAAGHLAELIRQYQPDVIVTYDENGFYGHPDHIQAHRITMAAVEQTDVPAKVYWTTVPRTAFEQFGQIMRELGVEWSEPDETAEPMPELGLPDDEISTWVDTSSFGAQKFDALATHASQTENIFFLQLGRERFTELMGVETFVRVRDRTGAPTPRTTSSPVCADRLTAVPVGIGHRRPRGRRRPCAVLRKRSETFEPQLPGATQLIRVISGSFQR